LSRSLGHEFDQFLKTVLPSMGLDWRRHRRRQVRRRVAERLRELHLRSLEEYHLTLLKNPPEAERFRTLLGVTISRFYRDPDMWEFIKQTVLPSLAGLPRAVMFSAGCASGEEPYTLAMLWQHDGPERTKPVILAMDIDETVLRRAEAGVYEDGCLRLLPKDLRDTYFSRQGRLLQLDPAVQSLVQFYLGDFTVIGPPKGIHLAFCRNLAYTYFGREERGRITQTFHQAIQPGGWLVIGATEKPDLTEGFEVQHPCVYRRI
jgi:chemotaxis protein methyltransferase CheR